MTNIDTARATTATARHAVWADADGLSQSLARAFHDDPLMTYLFRDEAKRPEKLPKVFRLLFKLGLPHGGCAVTSGYEAAALWRPPEQWEIRPWHYIANGAAFIDLFGGDIPHVLKTMDIIEKRHPHTPHWYLQVLGTDTLKQGKGYGSLVMRHQLEIIDAHTMPAYLESSKESNIPIYSSYGFEVTGEITFPNGPTIYPMWRKPRP
jgi:ribosomal protein S18 acetylase RimI-like enzyme